MAGVSTPEHILRDEEVNMPVQGNCLQLRCVNTALNILSVTDWFVAQGLFLHTVLFREQALKMLLLCHVQIYSYAC